MFNPTGEWQVSSQSLHMDLDASINWGWDLCCCRPIRHCTTLSGEDLATYWNMNATGPFVKDESLCKSSAARWSQKHTLLHFSQSTHHLYVTFTVMLIYQAKNEGVCIAQNMTWTSPRRQSFWSFHWPLIFYLNIRPPVWRSPGQLKFKRCDMMWPL